jgi:glycosyltransferase involved in cell wall biosynthesis
MRDLSIIMPCLNEAETLGSCILKARKSIEALGLDGEIIVADNGSTDGFPKKYRCAEVAIN